MRRDYSANGGWETFLSYEDPGQDILIGLLRLRKLAGPEATRQPELKGKCSMVRRKAITTLRCSCTEQFAFAVMCGPLISHVAYARILAFVLSRAAGVRVVRTAHQYN